MKNAIAFNYGQKCSSERQDCDRINTLWTCARHTARRTPAVRRAGDGPHACHIEIRYALAAHLKPYVDYTYTQWFSEIGRQICGMRTCKSWDSREDVGKNCDYAVPHRQTPNCQKTRTICCSIRREILRLVIRNILPKDTSHLVRNQRSTFRLFDPWRTYVQPTDPHRWKLERTLVCMAMMMSIMMIDRIVCSSICMHSVFDRLTADNVDDAHDQPERFGATINVQTLCHITEIPINIFMCMLFR